MKEKSWLGRWRTNWIAIWVEKSMSRLILYKCGGTFIPLLIAWVHRSTKDENLVFSLCICAGTFFKPLGACPVVQTIPRRRSLQGIFLVWVKIAIEVVLEVLCICGNRCVCLHFQSKKGCRIFFSWRTRWTNTCPYPFVKGWFAILEVVRSYSRSDTRDYIFEWLDTICWGISRPDSGLCIFFLLQVLPPPSQIFFVYVQILRSHNQWNRQTTMCVMFQKEQSQLVSEPFDQKEAGDFCFLLCDFAHHHVLQPISTPCSVYIWQSVELQDNSNVWKCVRLSAWLWFMEQFAIWKMIWLFFDLISLLGALKCNIFNVVFESRFAGARLSILRFRVWTYPNRKVLWTYNVCDHGCKLSRNQWHIINDKRIHLPQTPTSTHMKFRNAARQQKTMRKLKSTKFYSNIAETDKILMLKKGGPHQKKACLCDTLLPQI